jgi:hypothetical protein
MAVNKVDLHVSQIIEDLNNGLTWLKKDDLGYGSIQDKYGAKDQQIAMIRKHPKLKDAETTVTVFNIIDDTAETPKPTPAAKPAPVVVDIPEILTAELTTTDAESADVFANL